MADPQQLRKDAQNTPREESSFVPNREQQTPPREQAVQSAEQPERRPESEDQQSGQENFLDDAIEGLRGKLKKSKRQRPTHIPQVRDELTVKVEKIMEEGLADAFNELSPIERQEFKIKGEETALQIRELLKATHIKIKKVFKLLFTWLKLLPGINRFYLEQEAKIKSDKIVSLHQSTSIKKR